MWALIKKLAKIWLGQFWNLLKSFLKLWIKMRLAEFARLGVVILFLAMFLLICYLLAGR